MSDTIKTVIIIAGPTAVGKTTAAISVARHFATEIISADSRQCYRELSIGVARPSEAELTAVPHHFIASHSIHEKVSAATFEAYALQKVTEIFKQHHVAVMVGGTGLYIQAFCEGLDAIPPIPVDLHEKLMATYKTNGLEWLQNETRKKDPLFYERGEIQNPRRLLRALEVVEVTGQSILSFRKTAKAHRQFNIIKVALHLPKETLHQRINHRVDDMMQQGLLEEAQSLIPCQQLNALQTVGYKELFEHFNGTTTVGTATEKIKIATRQYAKRQLTWFRKDDGYQWCLPLPEEVISLIHKNIG